MRKKFGHKLEALLDSIESTLTLVNQHRSTLETNIEFLVAIVNQLIVMRILVNVPIEVPALNRLHKKRLQITIQLLVRAELEHAVERITNLLEEVAVQITTQTAR